MSSDVSVCLSIKQQLYPLPPPGELTNGAPAPNKWLAAEMSKLGLILTLPHKLGPGWREQTASIVNSRAVNGTSQNFTKLGEAEKHLLAAKIITDGRLLGSLLTKSLDASGL